MNKERKVILSSGNVGGHLKVITEELGRKVGVRMLDTDDWELHKLLSFEGAMPWNDPRNPTLNAPEGAEENWTCIFEGEEGFDEAPAEAIAGWGIGIQEDADGDGQHLLTIGTAPCEVMLRIANESFYHQTQLLLEHGARPWNESRPSNISPTLMLGLQLLLGRGGDHELRLDPTRASMACLLISRIYRNLLLEATHGRSTLHAVASTAILMEVLNGDESSLELAANHLCDITSIPSMLENYWQGELWESDRAMIEALNKPDGWTVEKRATTIVEVQEEDDHEGEVDVITWRKGDLIVQSYDGMLHLGWVPAIEAVAKNEGPKGIKVSHLLPQQVTLPTLEELGAERC